LSWKPFFASGKLVKDYEPLKKYLELSKGTDAYERAFIGEEDFRRLKEVAHGKKLGELWDELTEELKERIDPQIALEALREAGLEAEDPETARKEIAKLLAGWLLEAGEEWDIIRFKDVTPE